jgi:hypothetical protein
MSTIVAAGSDITDLGQTSGVWKNLKHRYDRAKNNF